MTLLGRLDAEILVGRGEPMERKGEERGYTPTIFYSYYAAADIQ
jgi:hypothetical protein